MNLGLARGKVRLAPYDTDWKREFAREAASLRSALGQIILQVEHIGGTSIEGMMAKPIIDLMVVISSAISRTAMEEPLAKLGYEYRANGCTHDRIFFAKGVSTCRTHYLSITQLHLQFYKEKLAFRDYLRTHPQAAMDYCRLKQKLAALYQNDRALYTEGKRAFVEQILSDACDARPSVIFEIGGTGTLSYKGR